MSRFFVAVIVVLILFLSSGSLCAQHSEKKPLAAKEVQQPEKESSLRVFQDAKRIDASEAVSLISVLLYGAIGIVIIMFLLIGYFYEPSESSKPYNPTKVDRAEGFHPYRREREENRERIDLD